jgi:tetratricopeptide (TPR) repeat protein
MDIRNITKPDLRKLSSLYFQRAEIYYGLKEYNKCIEDLYKIISLNGNGTADSETYFHLAACNRNLGNYNRAIEAISKAIIMSYEPEPRYFIERGLSYYKTERYNLAIKDFLEGLKYFAIHPEATRTLALSYEKLGNIQGTMENMILAAEQGDMVAQEYIKNLGNFMDNEYNELFNQ